MATTSTITDPAAMQPPIIIRRIRLTTLVCYATFITLGIAGTLLGPALPELALRYNVPLSQAGIIPSVQAFGVFIGVLLSGWLLDRLNARTVLIIGALTLVVGLFTFGLAVTLPAALLMVIISGAGFGMLNVAPNVIVAMLYPANASAALSLLNVFYGVGAIIGPQISSLALGQGDYRIAYQITPVIALILAALLMTISVPRPQHIPINPNQPTSKQSGIRWSAVLPFVLIAFFYVSVEAANGSWIPTQMEKAALSSITIGALAASLFWIGITAGRLVAGLVLHRIRDVQLLLGGVALIVISATMMAVFGRYEIVGLFCAFALGLGCAATFPIVLAKALLSSPQAHGAVSGLMLAVASLGAIFGPWVQGLVSGPHDGGVIYTVVAGAIVLGLVIWANRRAARRMLIPS